jgi:hypothetical protein
MTIIVNLVTFVLSCTWTSMENLHLHIHGQYKLVQNHLGTLYCS